MSAFTHTEPDLRDILNDLRRREPIFHRPAFPTATAPEYWEVGASGRRYSRDFILRHLAQSPPADADTAGWQTSDHALRRLSPDTYLLTYTLFQHERLTRRATLWQQTPGGWVVLYHQGTTVAAEQDDVAPPQARNT
jgi:hypothetical protein